MSEGSLATVLFFGDGRHPFLFLIDEWTELQRKTAAGPWVVEERLISRTCSVEEIKQVLRIGLIGGGMKAETAFELVEAYVGKKPGDVQAGLLVAFTALSASLHGLDKDLTGES